MGTVTIYRFSIYDIRSDELVLSKRWGTREAIAKIGGLIIDSASFETDETALSNIEGLTEIGFAPPTASIIFPVLAETVDAEGVAP